MAHRAVSSAGCCNDTRGSNDRSKNLSCWGSWTSYPAAGICGGTCGIAPSFPPISDWINYKPGGFRHYLSRPHGSKTFAPLGNESFLYPSQGQQISTALTSSPIFAGSDKN